MSVGDIRIVYYEIWVDEDVNLKLKQIVNEFEVWSVQWGGGEPEMLNCLLCCELSSNAQL